MSRSIWSHPSSVDIILRAAAETSGADGDGWVQSLKSGIEARCDGRGVGDVAEGPAIVCRD